MLTVAELKKILSRVEELNPTWSVRLAPRLQVLPSDLEVTGTTVRRFTIALTLRSQTESYGDIASIVISDGPGGIVCCEHYRKGASDQHVNYQFLESFIIENCQLQLDAQRTHEHSLDEAARLAFFSN